MNMKFIDIGCVILLFIVAAAGGFFIQKNFSDNYSRIKQEKELLTQKNNKLKLELVNLEQFQSKYKNKKTQLQELNKRIPTAPRIGDLLTHLHARVKEREITLIDFNHKPGQVFESFKRIPVQIVVNGDFLNIYQLIHDLETLNRIFIFEKIVIQREEKKNLCRAVLLASVFQQ